MDTKLTIAIVYNLLRLACGWAVKTRQHRGKIKMYRLAREQARRLNEEYTRRQNHISKHYKNRLIDCLYCIYIEEEGTNSREEMALFDIIYTLVGLG